MTTECTHKPVISPREGVAMGAGARAEIAAPTNAPGQRDALPDAGPTSPGGGEQSPLGAFS